MNVFPFIFTLVIIAAVLSQAAAFLITFLIKRKQDKKENQQLLNTGKVIDFSDYENYLKSLDEKNQTGSTVKNSQDE